MYPSNLNESEVAAGAATIETPERGGRIMRKFLKKRKDFCQLSDGGCQLGDGILSYD